MVCDGRRISRIVLAARYSLLTYYYTQFANANQNGGTVARPLFFEFPTDPATAYLDQQFMVGLSYQLPITQPPQNNIACTHEWMCALMDGCAIDWFRFVNQSRS
jgi:hypothetical protein